MTDTNELIAAEAKPATKRPRKMAREPKVEAGSGSTTVAPTPTKRESKVDLVLSLLQRQEGVTLDQMVAATGWLPHTTRAALTGLKKKGYVVTSTKLEGGARVYQVAVQ